MASTKNGQIRDKQPPPCALSPFTLHAFTVRLRSFAPLLLKLLLVVGPFLSHYFRKIEIDRCKTEKKRHQQKSGAARQECGSRKQHIQTESKIDHPGEIEGVNAFLESRIQFVQFNLLKNAAGRALRPAWLRAPVLAPPACRARR